MIHLCDLEDIGCGIYRLRPAPDYGVWVSVRDAAQILNLPHRSLYAWLGEFLVYRKPLPAKVTVSKPSVLALKAALDAGTFDDRAGRARLRSQVAVEMAKLIQSSLAAAERPRR